MDGKDISIISQVCVKAAAELHAGTGRSDLALGAAEEFFAWIIERSLPTQGGETVHLPVSVAPPSPSPAPDTFPPACPTCSGPMWDNRTGKRNPKAPDAKCKDTNCGKGVWLAPYKPGGAG